MDLPVHSIAALRKGYAEGRWSVKAVAEAVLARAAAAEAVDPAIWIARVAPERLLARRGGARRQGPRRPAAVRRSVRGQGQHRRRRTADHRRLPRFRLSARAFGDRRSSGCARPARCSSARPISTSSPPASSACARPTARRAARSIRATSRAARAPARRSPWRAAWSVSRSAPTPPARAASRPRSAI